MQLMPSQPADCPNCMCWAPSPLTRCPGGIQCLTWSCCAQRCVRLQSASRPRCHYNAWWTFQSAVAVSCTPIARLQMHTSWLQQLLCTSECSCGECCRWPAQVPHRDHDSARAQGLFEIAWRQPSGSTREGRLGCQGSSGCRDLIESLSYSH